MLVNRQLLIVNCETERSDKQLTNSYRFENWNLARAPF